MKTKTWVLAALAFFIVAIGNASDFPKMNVVPVEAEKAMVAFQSDEASLLEITLTASNGEIVYFKKTKQRFSEYKKVFDFSVLGEGNYCLCVNFGNRSLNRTIYVDKNEIKVGPEQRLFEPYFSLNDKKLNVSFLNCPCKEVYVNIYRNGKHIEGINFGSELAIQKCIDLSNLGKGDYEVVLTDRFKNHKYIAHL